MNLHSMLHILCNAFSVNNVGSLWQWTREGAKRGKQDKADQPLVSRCEPLFLFSFIFLKRRMLGIKARNLTVLSSHLSICRGECLSSVYGSPIIHQEFCVKRLYFPLSLLSFLLIHSNRPFSISFPYSVVWKPCIIMCGGIIEKRRKQGGKGDVGQIRDPWELSGEI